MARLMKSCKCCGRRKPLKSFYPSAACKSCTREKRLTKRRAVQGHTPAVNE